MTTPPSRDSKSDLLEAARAAIRDREEKAAEAAVASRNQPRRRRMGVLAVIGIVGIVLLLVQPAWLVGPKNMPTEPPPVAAASLRLALLRQRKQVLEYAKAQGHLPEYLSESGDSVPGARYERTGDQAFRLSARAGDSLIVLQSSDSASVFLGSSIATIRNRGQQ